MKKKNLLVFVAVVVIIGIFIPYNRQEAIVVNASYINCYRQLITVQNWKNWLPEIHKVYNLDSSLYKIVKAPEGMKLLIPGTSFLVTQEGSTELHIKRTSSAGEDNFSFTIIPGSSVLSATIIVTCKTNLIKSVLKAHGGLDVTVINDFKRYMESASLYYGFNIEKDFESEKKMIVKKRTVPALQIYTLAGEMEKQLSGYISSKHLTQNGMIMVQYNTKNGDSVEMLMGIPVNRQIPVTNNFLYMYIPSTPVLTADFKGKYNDRKKIYSAMNDYLQDKYLHPKIAPFEEFKSGFPTGDNDITDFRLIYAIF